jgi:hypothetical protein
MWIERVKMISDKLQTREEEVWGKLRGSFFGFRPVFFPLLHQSAQHTLFFGIMHQLPVLTLHNQETSPLPDADGWAEMHPHLSCLYATPHHL